jgi:ATP-dependent Lon protease
MFFAGARRCSADDGVNHEVEALRRAVIAQFDQYVKLNKKIPPEILTSIAGIEEAGVWPTRLPHTCR